MDNKENFISIIEKLIALCAVRLSDDVFSRLEEIGKSEDSPLQKAIYDSYFENLKMAGDLNRPCCQDTGLLQFYLKAGTAFPHLDITADVINEAVRRSTLKVPLRPNAVNYFDNQNTGDNTGERCPWIDWEIIPGSKSMEICVYFSGAGCSLPGQAKVFKPSDGIEAIKPFVFDIVTGPGLNACPPLLVGIGLGHNIENAASLSKKAILRNLGVKNQNSEAASLENEIMEGLNKTGMGAQGLPGKRAVIGVHIESSARHTATRACAVNVSCYVLRRGIIRVNSDLTCEVLSHKGVTL